MSAIVPDRWEDYSNMGRQIPGTRFIAFKVPLRRAILDRLSSTIQEFDIRFLVDHCSSLGLVIDLTNTMKYYNSQEFLDMNIGYEKIFTAGHAIPSPEVVNRFFEIVETFLEQNQTNDKLIGVHCTHGVNRTGYLICRYMIQQLGVAPDQAIVDFNSARGHELERENYLNNLREAPWLQKARDSSRRSKNRIPDGYDNYEETPPYMPQKSRRRNRSFRGYDDSSFESNEGWSEDSPSWRQSGSYRIFSRGNVTEDRTRDRRNCAAGRSTDQSLSKALTKLQTGPTSGLKGAPAGRPPKVIEASTSSRNRNRPTPKGFQSASERNITSSTSRGKSYPSTISTSTAAEGEVSGRTGLNQGYYPSRTVRGGARGNTEGQGRTDLPRRRPHMDRKHPNTRY